MNDYVFLEDVGRRVGEWGMEIGRGGFSVRGSERSRGTGRDKGRGRGRGGNASSPRTKQDVLKQQLEFRDIEIELLPAGMERKKLNKSIWDFKFVHLQSNTIISLKLHSQKKDSTFNHRIQIPRSPRPLCSIHAAT